MLVDLLVNPDPERSMKNPKAFVLPLVSGSVAMWYALRLSAPGRGPVDHVVLAAIAGWIGWALWGLVRRLWADEGRCDRAPGSGDD